MPNSFQLIMPDPDPDEEPLELAEQVDSPPASHQHPTHPGPDRSLKHDRDSRLASLDIRQPDNLAPSAEEMQECDPDELWQKNAAREAQENLRFSLAEMFLVTAILAVLMTLGRFVRLPMLAGVLGVLVLVGMGVISTNSRSRLTYLVWITLIAGYVFISIGAAWKTAD